MKKFWLIFKMIILLMSASSVAFAEYNFATDKTESVFYSTEQEEAMGASVAASVEKHYKLVNDVDVNERVKKILDRIVKICDRKDIIYTVAVLDEEDINAVSLPGGYIYVFKGLIDKVKNDDQLAGVIAHEVGHITARHSVKRLQAAYAALLLQVASMQAGGEVASGTNLALNSIFSAYSQADEFQADDLAVKYMGKAKYDVNQVLTFLEILQTENNKKIRPHTYFRTHPYLGKRISNVRVKIRGNMNFREYLNLIGD